MKNNRGRNKFFSCFRPVVIDDVPVSDDLTKACAAVGGGGGGGKESTVIPKISKSINDKDVDDPVVDARCRKSKSSRRFKRLLKSVLFDISLPKKLRNRKSSKNDNVDGSLKSYKFSDSLNEKSSSFTETSDTDDTLRINSTRSSSIFSSSTNASSSLSSSVSSSCDSSLSSNSRSSSQRTGTSLFQVESSNQIPKNENEIYCSTIIVWLFLLCLLVLIFCGKLGSIFCTLACFFLCSRRSKDLNSPAGYVDLQVNMDTKEYKKKIIMLGLLDRDRSRLL